MYYFFLQGNGGAIATIQDAIRFDSLEDAKKHPIIKSYRAVIIMTEDEQLQEATIYPYHLAHYYSPDCGWAYYDEKTIANRANLLLTFWDC